LENDWQQQQQQQQQKQQQQQQTLLNLTGVDVMITIFCDFRQFSAKKLAFFSKTNVMIKIFAKTSSSLSKKRQYFR
jgi:hypothetical protein